ncbi:DNA mismatch repair protein MutT [Bacillaceae bacterium JMAK1]|nr:DNA mismatch repair protein MutT [Bacillaceae bacterium JMAK1]
MKKWLGSSGVCINQDGQLLMVLQGKPEEKKTWSIPSGGKEQEETFEECCIREVKEETGYTVEVVGKLKVKQGTYEQINVAIEAHYFFVNVVGGKRNFQDPDNLIYDIAWKDVDELKTLELTFPEDQEFLINYIIKVSQ